MKETNFKRLMIIKMKIMNFKIHLKIKTILKIKGKINKI
jgi:hypothetical protein